MKVSACKLLAKQKRKISAVLFTVMLTELLLPLKALALTSGPTQPEFQGFTPLATTSLVDPFSGDFSYNIPLLEIDGYPLNLVYKATSNIEEEGSWVGYGWNVNVGTLNRMVRGLPDDMNGEDIKYYQNIRERNVESWGVSVQPKITVMAGLGNGIGLSAGVQAEMGYTEDQDDYTGKSVGVSFGAGVFANASLTIGAGVGVSAGASAGVTLAANSSTGGSLSVYAGFNAGISYGDYFSAGLGKSVNRTFNTISGWENPSIVGSYNIGALSREVHKNFLNSVSNSIPQISSPYLYTSNGKGFKLDIGVELGLLDGVGIDLGLGITVTDGTAKTVYGPVQNRKGYGYMYVEKATASDLLDFTRDNDGGLNKDMPFLPPAMKTYDVFASTAHNATNSFRADRNDFGVVRDPKIDFDNTKGRNELHQVTVRVISQLTCWIGIRLRYDNFRTFTEGHVASGGCIDDMVPFRTSDGKDQNLFFKACGSPSMADDDYINQVNKFGHYGLNTGHTIKGITDKKRPVTAEPIAVYTNDQINSYPQTVIPKQLERYVKNAFPGNLTTSKTTAVTRPTGNEQEKSKIGAVLNVNKAGQTYVYATPVKNNIKSEVAFRVSGFETDGYREREGLLKITNQDNPATQAKRDHLYKSTLTPGYATSYMLNSVLSPDYVDVKNDGVTDDDLGTFVKFNYTRTEDDYRWRVPYSNADTNFALLNEGIKLTKFDNMASYVAGSKELWYTHSIESKNSVAEFYLSDRDDAFDTKIGISNPSYSGSYANAKANYGRMQRLDKIVYYNKHDRYIHGPNAVPLKTIYFEYDYNISSKMPNAVGPYADTSGKLRLTKVKIQHGTEPMQYAETYDLGYTATNPAYNIGDKDAWGNYYPNSRSLPLAEFPYIDQTKERHLNDEIASAFHLNKIGLPSGGEINIEYEADDYSWVQNRRAMALTQVEGVGNSPNLMQADVFGLYDPFLNPFLYIYTKAPQGVSINKSSLLNGSNIMYFSFNINIGGNAFSIYDQVKGYAEVDDIGTCPNNSGYIYIKVRPAKLTGTDVKPSPMTNMALNTARAFASDQLYFQENEYPDGHARNHGARLKKAAIQVADALLGKNSVKELMKDYKAGQKYKRDKSFVKLVLGKKVGGGSRVSRLTFDDEWNQMATGESSSLVGYKYIYQDAGGTSYGVASYEPLLGGEENPFRSGTSYQLSNNPSKYPPYDPIEQIKEDPVGESFLPTGSVGYSKVIIESIHKQYARSAQSKLVHEFYTAKDFPFSASFSGKNVQESEAEENPNPGLRDVMLAFLGYASTMSSTENRYTVSQSFVIETNDMHGKAKATFNYRLLPANNKEELVNSTEYLYHTSGSGLSNEVDVIKHVTTGAPLPCEYGNEWEYNNYGKRPFPKENIKVQKKTLGVDIDVCSDSREVVTTETREQHKKGGGIKICLPPHAIPSFTWVENTHKHTNYFKSITTTKIVNKYGILKSVRTFDEGAETVVENKYYDPVTGAAVVQTVKNKYGDEMYNTNIPAYWTNTSLEPAYMEYPFLGNGTNSLIPTTLQFTNVPLSTGVAFLSACSLVHARFTTSEDIYHQGDEIFARGTISGGGGYGWHRLYVSDVLVKKTGYGDPDPLAMRYGNGQNCGSTEFEVFVTPYKVTGSVTTGELGHGKDLTGIDAMFRYRSGRKNMLDLSAGSYQTLQEPFKVIDSVIISAQGEGGGCKTPSFMRPTINATANRYDAINSIPEGKLNDMVYNPVTSGVISQPYLSATYVLYGNRQDPGSQRRNGILNNWYYWLPNRYDETQNHVPRKALMTTYNHDPELYSFTQVTKAGGNATWHTASKVTRSIPSVGPVEEVNALGIYSSIFSDPTTKKVLYVTANGKNGQTWVESFENMRQLRVYNQVTDFMYSLFQKTMAKVNTTTGYEVFNTSQSGYTVDNSTAHTGLYSINVGSSLSIAVQPVVYASNTRNFYPTYFNFNLNDTAKHKYTCEVWAQGNGTAPSINTIGGVVNLTAVSGAIDGWTLYRATVDVKHTAQVTFTFPSGRYDDLRVYPAAANVKSYVYHPFKSYLMAVLDENNLATFYEYNNRNQLVRLKKETEKGVITITENIKNARVKAQ